MTTDHYRAVLLVVTTLVAVACGEKNPAGPTPSPSPTVLPTPQPGGATTTVSGKVIEVSDSGEARPVPNLRLKVRVGRSDGAVGGAELPEIVTDANGRYEITQLSDMVILFISTPPGSTHRFLCDQYPLVVSAVRGFPFIADLLLVAATWSGDRPPPGMGWPGTSVFGVVREGIDGTLQPVSGATVAVESGTQDPPATTNAKGFYMVCSVVGTDTNRTIIASKDGYQPAMRTFFGGWESKVDMEIRRQ